MASISVAEGYSMASIYLIQVGDQHQRYTLIVIIYAFVLQVQVIQSWGVVKNFATLPSSSVLLTSTSEVKTLLLRNKKGMYEFTNIDLKRSLELRERSEAANCIMHQ